MLLLFLFLICILLIILNVSVPFPLTNLPDIMVIVYGILVLLLGKYISYSFLKHEVCNRKIILKYYYLSFLISLLFLKYCWTPFLLPNNANWGFDPQRYYIYALQVIQKGYYDGWVGSGFDGIVYIYAFIFRLIGIHPLIPLYLNILLSLLSVLMLYKIFCNHVNNDIKYVGLLLFIPELLYFNVMSSKDTLCQFFLIFVFYYFYKLYWLKNIKSLFFLLLNLSLLLFLRLPYGFAAMSVILVFLLFFTKRVSNSAKLFIISLFLPIAIWGLNITSVLSSSDTMQEDLGARIESYATGNVNALDNGSAIASYLTPHNSFEVFVYGIIRSIFYLFPEGHYTFFDRYEINALGGLTQLLSGVVSALLICVAYHYVKKTFKYKYDKGILLILFCLFFMLLISFSTPNFIHQRYRITFDYFYFLLVILAFMQLGKKRCFLVVKKWTLCLFALGLIYMFIKFLK